MSIAIVCYCPRCDYFIKTAVQSNAVGSHLCVQCDGLMEVYIAQGEREVVVEHDEREGLLDDDVVHIAAMALRRWMDEGMGTDKEPEPTDADYEAARVALAAGAAALTRRTQ